MKKAKRLLAVLLAALMIFGSASVSSYAYISEAEDWNTATLTGGEKYYFSYDQGATWVLDMLDGLLEDIQIVLTCEELNGIANVGVNIFTSNILLNLDDYLEDHGAVDENGKPAVDLRSVDGLIKTLAGVFDCLNSGGLSKIANFLGLLGDLIKDNGLQSTGLNDSILRYNGTQKDTAVLEMLVLWISNQKPMLQSMLAGTFDFGSLLKSLLGDMLGDLLPVPIQWGSQAGVSNAINTQALIRDLLYNMLVDSTVTSAPEGSTLDSWVQQLINWALIDGTGTDAASGGFSMLGVNAEPLMPAMGNQPGGASIGGETITVDRNKDGVTETATMSFYQLVNNLINSLMGGMLHDMLYDLLIDMLEIEVTEELPMGDPAILQDEMFSLILGAVEGLLTANGAPTITYTEDEMNYPLPRVKKLLNWLLVGDTANGVFPALDSFILIDYYGLHIQDNFMSLLNDVARLLINLLPSLGLFASSEHLAYTPDQLNESWYIDADFNLVSSLDDSKVTQTYVTYETNEVIYPVDFVTDADGVSTPVAYCYLDDKSAVDLMDANGENGDVNGDLIRPNYVITTKMVFANIIKLAFNDMVDGCYFPEWTTDIPSVLAYGVAAIAAPVVPENNYYERLDVYHELVASGSLSTSMILADGEEVEALPYTSLKRIPIKAMDGAVTEYKDVTVPSAALDILCSFAADRLNGVFHFNNDVQKFTTETSLERFACEFLIWAVNQYMPAFIGQWNATNKRYEAVTVDIDGTSGSATYSANGIFADIMTTTVNALYDDFAKRTVKVSANWDVVYELIDGTLFKLLPSSWLPDLNGSAQLFNEWLFGNLINFDLQGILGLLTVNTDPAAELNKSVTQVLLNIIDRVLALVFNDNAILEPSGRTNVVTANNTTTYTTLNQILDCSSTDAGLPKLIWNLLDFLNKYKNPLLSTILPLVISSSYSRPYDREYLTANGRTEATYGIETLENYLSDIYDNNNAYPVKTFTNEADAEAATDGRATAMKNADGVSTDVVLSNGTIFGTYSSLQEAKEVIDSLKKAYYTSECVDETLPEEQRTYTYTVYFAVDYLTSAKNVNATQDSEGRAYNEYSGFSYAQITSRTAADPFISYDDDYKFFEYEDFGPAGYYYNNEGDARKNAEGFIGEYYGFVDTLGDAYGVWYMFYIESELKKAGLLDTNGDGRYLTADVTEGDVTYYADGDPSVPEAMYPYYTRNANTFYYYDVDKAVNYRSQAVGLGTFEGFISPLTGKPVTTVSSADFTTNNFQQLAMAVEAGLDPEQNVALSVEDTEKIVRLILGTLEFDITLNGDGAYNGSLQWNDLSPEQLTTIINWLNANGFTYEEYIEENGDASTNGTAAYILKRPKFRFIQDGSMSFTNGTYTHAAAPNLNAADIANRARKSMVGSDTYEDEMIIAISQGYYDYVGAVYANRERLYNEIDECSWRIENAEGGRALTAETTMIKWVLDLTADAYMGAKGRNYGFEYDENGNQVYNPDGTPSVVKMYTTTSYEKFRNAYDFAEDVYAAAKNGNILASGITQSMLTAAYEGLLKAWQQLVKFTGFADWEQIDSFVAMAESILADPYVDDPQFGVQSGLTELVTALTDALVYTDYVKENNESSSYDNVANSKQNYDSEYQAEIDLAAANLNKAIQNLVYFSNPSLSQDPDAEEVVTILPTVYENQIQYAHIFGLKEGVGFGDGTLTAQDVIDSLGLKVTGMAVGGDSTISRSNASRGAGTDARIDGRYQNYLRFRYFAVLYGDLNGDTRIDGTDAAAVKLYIDKNENTSALMGEAKFEAADVTHNGSVDEEDWMLITSHYTLTDIDLNEDGVPDVIDQNAHGPVAQVIAE